MLVVTGYNEGPPFAFLLGPAMKTLFATALVLLVPASVFAQSPSSDEWSFHSPRDEIRPDATFRSAGGYQGGPQWVITGEKPGQVGHWQRQFPVEGGKHYQFTVQRRTIGMELPRRGAIARVIWLDADGNQVLRRDPVTNSYRPGERPRAEPEFLKPESVNPSGPQHRWTKLQGTYLAPPDAEIARWELHYRWEDDGSVVSWSQPTIESVAQPAPRIVRLAAVHYQPRAGQTRQEKCEQFEPLIAAAAQQDVDLVVLPETLTYYGTKGT